MSDLILASKSKVRKEILEKHKINCLVEPSNIDEEPIRYLILFVKKVISFLFIDIKSSQPNYYNPFHYLPLLLLGVTSLIGILISDKKSYKLNYLILIFFTTIFIFSVFFKIFLLIRVLMKLFVAFIGPTV